MMKSSWMQSLALLALLSLLILRAVAFAQENATVTAVPDDTGERKPLLTVVPLYPEKARRARVEGEVQVCFNVSRQGRTSRVAVRNSTNRVFEKPSRDAIKASTYRPLAADKTLSGIKTCRTFKFHLTPVAIEMPAQAPG
jgi:TonB family protein